MVFELFLQAIWQAVEQAVELADRSASSFGDRRFGYVSLEQHKETKAYYALKALSKGHLVMNGMQVMADL